jgi:hypothetical protein
MNDNLTTRPDDVSRLPSVFNVLAGIWLIVAAWVLGFGGVPVAAMDTLLVGIAVLVLAVIRLAMEGTTGLSWLNFVVGIWLLISPFVLRFNNITAAMTNAVIFGVLVLAFSLWAALASQTATPVRR